MHLSVIIPTLSRPHHAQLLGERICALLPSLQIEIIVVQPPAGDPDRPGIPAPNLADGARIVFVTDSGHGVYLAYRAGLAHASGEYCWFVGDDDYPLDGVTELAQALLAGESDLLVAPVIFSSGRLYRPTRSALILHFLNWCQQGVIYRRSLFERYPFHRRLRVLADQYVNILLLTNPAVRKAFFPKPICVFGLHGLSGRQSDPAYRSLRAALARRTLSTGAFLVFQGIAAAEPVLKPMVKRLVKM